MFHAYSGCDTTSAFNGKGKKSAWRAWQAYDDVTETFVHLAKSPFQLLDVDSQQFQKLERLTVILYDKSSPESSINQARKEIFCRVNRQMEKLPPTQDVLLQQIRRAVYQAGEEKFRLCHDWLYVTWCPIDYVHLMIIHLCHMIYCIFHDFTTKMSPIGLISILSHITGIWTTSTKAEQTIPTPQGYGWNKELGSWVPVWSTIPEVSRACRGLIKCSCKGDCSTCKCGKANLDCSPLCKCNC